MTMPLSQIIGENSNHRFKKRKNSNFNRVQQSIINFIIRVIKRKNSAFRNLVENIFIGEYFI